jgi:uncharacterized protein (TIGR02246 family)
MTVDDLEAIRQLKARYFRCMDTKDWDGMRQVFAPDVHVDMEAEGGGVHDDVESFFTMLIAAIGEVTTVHHGHMPEIEITSPTTATGIWAMEDMLRWPDGTEMHGYGHYHETYVKLDGDWRIKSLRLARLRVDFAPAEATTA